METPNLTANGDYANCPAVGELVRFALGAMPHERLMKLERHVRDCPQCLEQLDASSDMQDDLVEALRRPADAEPFDRLKEDHIVDLVRRTVARSRREASPARHGGVAPGTVVGPYRLIDAVGQGSYAIVYRAEHLASRRPVAVKLLSGVADRSSEAAARFQRELDIMRGWQHENVVAAIDGGQYVGRPFLVMPWVDGVNLASVVRRAQSLSVPTACAIACQTAEGLQYAHGCGVVHRDLKPSNLMLCRGGTVRILDLGLALLKLADAKGRRLTSSGQILGTADYIAPEQIDDSRQVDVRADLYSLGCVLFELLSGQPPFGVQRYRSTMAKLRAHRTVPAPPLEHILPDVPAAVAAVLAQLLSKLPEDRPCLPNEVVERLAPWCGGNDLAALADQWVAGT